ncbi:MAG: hypothetical protein ACE149_01535 [Armatimonadota bacterium]
MPKPEADTAASERRLWPVCLLVFAGALAIRAAYAYTRPIPVSADTSYYLMVARNLYHGRGFVADFVWNYLGGLPTGLPVPSNEYWMPGQSVVLAAAFALTRDVSLRVAQWPSLIFGALLCAVTAWMAGAISGRRLTAALAGAAAAVNYYLVELTLHPDHFMLNAVLVNLSLLALWSAWRGGAWMAAPAGALAALAYLTRSDGALLVLVALLVALVARRRTKRYHGLRLVADFAIGFVLVALPWWIRQTVVFGTPSGANPLRTMFLTEYNDLFRLDQSRLNWDSYLASGQLLAWDPKGKALLLSLRILAKAVLLLGVLALGALGFRELRRESAPWLIYLVIGVLVPTLLVPYPARKGGVWHLAPALLPVIIALGAAGAVRIVEGARNRAALRTLAFVGAAVGFASLLSWWVYMIPQLGLPQKPIYPPVVAEAVAALGPRPAPALTDNAWGLYHAAGIPCAQFPSDGAPAALKVADAIGARYLITRANAPDTIPAMKEVIGNPRFRPLARYPAGETSVLVYRIAPPRKG